MTTAAARIMSRAVAEVWDTPVNGVNNVPFSSMTREQLEATAADLARELAVMRRAWQIAAPGISAGHVRLADKAKPAKREPLP